MQYNSEVVPVKKIEVDPSTFLSQDQPVNSPKELIQKADDLLENPLEIEADETKKEATSGIPLDTKEIPVEPIVKSPEPKALPQSPKAVREYQIFENFEDP